MESLKEISGEIVRWCIKQWKQDQYVDRKPEIKEILDQD